MAAATCVCLSAANVKRWGACDPRGVRLPTDDLSRAHEEALIGDCAPAAGAAPPWRASEHPSVPGAAGGRGAPGLEGGGAFQWWFNDGDGGLVFGRKFGDVMLKKVVLERSVFTTSSAPM